MACEAIIAKNTTPLLSRDHQPTIYCRRRRNQIRVGPAYKIFDQFCRRYFFHFV